MRAAWPRTIRDDHGREFTLAAPPQRIVSLAPSHTEAVYALGAGERIVAADTYSDYPPAARAKATLRCWPQPPTERILDLKPDLVLLYTESSDVQGHMVALRLTPIKLFPRRLDEAYETLELLGAILGREKEAETLVRSMRQRVAAVQARLRGAAPRRALLELDALDPARPYVAGGGGFYGDLLTLAGARNVFADSPEPALPAGAEQIVRRDPEILFLGDSRSPSNPQSPAKVRQRPGWRAISAVRQGRIYPVQGERLTRASPRLVEGLEELARLAHPERFR